MTGVELNGKVVLLTGAKRVGVVVAESLARLGCDAALVYNRSAKEAEEAAAAIRHIGRRAITLQANLAQPEDCRRVVEQTVAQLGGIDVLIAMASIYTPTPLESLTIGEWDLQLNVELRSAFLCAQASAPHMRARGGGRIVVFSDWVAASGRPRYQGFTHYYVAKAGLKALAESLALELARDQILVNAIAPGPILPPPDTTAAEIADVERSTPLGRWGGEEEIARTVRFLLESDFVTGETIRVDGGRHVK